MTAATDVDMTIDQDQDQKIDIIDEAVEAVAVVRTDLARDLALQDEQIIVIVRENEAVAAVELATDEPT